MARRFDEGVQNFIGAPNNFIHRTRKEAGFFKYCQVLSRPCAGDDGAGQLREDSCRLLPPHQSHRTTRSFLPPSIQAKTMATLRPQRKCSSLYQDNLASSDLKAPARKSEFRCPTGTASRPFARGRIMSRTNTLRVARRNGKKPFAFASAASSENMAFSAPLNPSFQGTHRQTALADALRASHSVGP